MVRKKSQVLLISRCQNLRLCCHFIFTVFSLKFLSLSRHFICSERRCQNDFAQKKSSSHLEPFFYFISLISILLPFKCHRFKSTAVHILEIFLFAVIKHKDTISWDIDKLKWWDVEGERPRLRDRKRWSEWE